MIAARDGYSIFDEKFRSIGLCKHWSSEGHAEISCLMKTKQQSAIRWLNSRGHHQRSIGGTI
jgi:hypothetical protein